MSDQDIAQLENNLALVDKLGDLVGSWERGSAQCRQTSFTVTIKFEKRVDPFQVDEFVNMMVACPGLYGPTVRRLLALDAETKVDQ